MRIVGTQNRSEIELGPVNANLRATEDIDVLLRLSELIRAAQSALTGRAGHGCRSQYAPPRQYPGTNSSP